MKKAIILGGGFSGCVWAHMLGELGWQVDLYERAPYLGGGCRTQWFGGHPYTLGPRHLFTPYKRSFDFFEERLPQRRLAHYLLTYVERDNQFYSYPMHEDDIGQMPDQSTIRQELLDRPPLDLATNFEEYWLASVGPTLYEKFVKNYSRKMWQIESNTQITDFRFDGKGIQLRKGTHEVSPHLYISYPYDPAGWNKFFDETTVQTPNVNIHLNKHITEIDGDNTRVKIDGEWIKGDIMVSSFSPDFLFKKRYGELQYIGRDFMKIVLPIEHAIPDPTFFLHYANDEPFTRIVEYKKLTMHQAPNTLLGIEIPSTKNKLYPYPVKEQQDLAQKYFDDMPENLISVGRMGNYRYFDIGMIINEAYDKIEKLNLS